MSAPSPGRAGGLARLDAPPVAATLLVLVCAVSFLDAMHPILNTDLGWHLALGRWIAEHGAVPHREPFTYTAHGAPMVAHEWLAQLGYYLVVRAGGLLALRLVHAALAVGVLLMLWRMLRREGAAPLVSVLGVLVYAVLAWGRFQVRPQMLSLFAFAAFYGWLFVGRPRLGAAQLAAAALGTALWANLHSGAFLLPALCWGYLAVEAVQQRTGWRAPRPDDLGGGDLRRLAALAGCTSLALLATPNGWHVVPYVLETRRINARLSGEWLPLLDYWGSPLTSPLRIQLWWLVLVGAVWAGIDGLRRGASLSRLAVVMVLAAAPLESQRFVDLAFAPIVWIGAETTARLSARPRAALAVAAASGLAVVAFLCVRAVEIEPARLVLRGERSFRQAAFPEQAMTFLEEVPLDGRLFTPTRWGGYVLMRTYDRYPIFADGRWVTLGERVVRDNERIVLREPDTPALLDAYDVDLLLVDRGWMTDALREQQGWRAVFLNRNAAVFVRRRDDDLRRVAAYYRERGIPFDPERGFDERAAVAANPAWAAAHQVKRVHLVPTDRGSGEPGALYRAVAGW